MKFSQLSKDGVGVFNKESTIEIELVRNGILYRVSVNNVDVRRQIVGGANRTLF
jgi:hypothetical protein